jgi:arsenite methyltransferase
MSAKETQADDTAIKKAVEEKYAAIARGAVKSCCSSEAGAGDCASVVKLPQAYTSKDLAAVPEGADLGLGCGDPTANADLKPGQTVLDLGSGAGVDCFLAARKVAPAGRVIGVDMTDAMLERARANARSGGFDNVEFRKGEIERLPVASGTVDRIISNCVINLAPDKSKVFGEAHRVLKSGGAITVSDIVSFGNVPPAVRSDLEKWAGCTAGAMDKQAYLGVIRDAGFREVAVINEVVYEHQRGADYGFASVTVRATK